MQPRVAVAIAADYNGRWAQQVVNDAKIAATGVKAAGASMGQSMHAANGNVANLAAQFNDIGVTLASGQSPLTIALQQGTQISQVLGPLGAAGSAKALGGAVLSMLSPVSLLTIATIGLGAAVVQWLMGINKGAPEADDRLKQHREWLDKVLVGYDEARKGADRYIDETKKLPSGAVNSELGAQQIKTTEQYTAALKALKDSRDSYLEDKTKLFWETPDAIAQADALKRVRDQLDLTNPQFDSMITALTEIKNSAANEKIAKIAQDMLDGAQAAKNFRGEMAGLASAIATAAAAAAGFPSIGKGFSDAIGNLGSLGQPNLDERGKAAAARDAGLAEAQDAVTRTTVLKAYNAALARIDTRDAEEEALKRTKEAEAAGKSLADSYAGVTRSLADQLAVLGMTSIEQEKYEQVRAAGIDANSKEADAIRGSVQALNDRKDALEVINAMKSPAEIAGEEVDRLAEIYANGELDAEQYAWAVQRALSKVPDVTGAMASKVGDILGSLATVMQSSGEEQFGIAKGLSVAMAVLKGYEAVTSAYAAGALIGGPLVGALYAGAAFAATAAQISNIMSTTSKSSSMKGGTSGGASGGTSSAAAPVEPAAQPGRAANVTLVGTLWRRSEIEALVGALNDALGDGVKLNVH